MRSAPTASFRRLVVVMTAMVSLLFASSCRTSRPSGAQLAPLTATSADEAMQQLQARRDAFHGVRALMKIRAVTPARTQSFKANLTLENERKMSFTAYTPVGSAALYVFADGERVKVKNRLEGTDWEGSARDLGKTMGLLAGSLTPAEMGMLIVGIPPRGDIRYEAAPSGLASAVSGDVQVQFDPPAFPSQHVVVTRGNERYEIDLLEVVE